MRVQGILEMNRQGTRSSRYPNCTAFREAFGMGRQTALRDLDFLRDDWGAPIAYDASRKGYFLTDPAWTVPALKLDRREVFALGIARKVMAAFRGTPLEADMQSALARVAAALEGHVSMDPRNSCSHGNPTSGCCDRGRCASGSRRRCARRWPGPARAAGKQLAVGSRQ